MDRARFALARAPESVVDAGGPAGRYPVAEPAVPVPAFSLGEATIARLTRGRLTVLALRLSAPIRSSNTAEPGRRHLRKLTDRSRDAPLR
ncbi:MAG: hypothetical protein IPM89_00015 [Candidatus Competibacteraceae bacterium]|nr:MAG: hypothetical protein IPM89_00015 [Candidatus Competibacteraceae bacterium]